METRIRSRLLKDGERGRGPIIYWMSRDQRAEDNWALLFAQEQALELKAPLCVVFYLAPQFLGATVRQYTFMLAGLHEVEQALAKKNIPFLLLTGSVEAILQFSRKVRASALVTDFDPLRVKRQWKEKVAKRLAIPFFEVDAHNIVPCWIASPKQEYSAATFRPKLKLVLPDFLHEFPRLRKHPYSWLGKHAKIGWSKAAASLQLDQTVGEVRWLTSGARAARSCLKFFLSEKLALYPVRRNDPTADGQSNLSPYLHFGQISAQRVALEVRDSVAPESAKQAFLEELIVRRELSDNFCFYNPQYDSAEAFPKWAKKTLAEHQNDERQYVYSLEQLEQARTHDELWNASQLEMMKTGKMHGYMRMYWAKKILEWTRSPEEAMQIAIYLNDRYELDGRDPNGYTGIAWSIGGVHDRAWPSRPIFGKIRYMSYGGAKSKLDVKAYIQKVGALNR
ncbi:MAG: deoxyribodipyrimidine photo-lyase [Candidatus Abyssobacteria bacterium SURF_5]|uniref:Deoxyribodipyrimidine photo-lyase n=1 Tax=Abyssobacteria bacterium (strain SURF_5) TaxID=2093360 RepID=A0A3A4NZR8_ABYX5|nr:MAG: deoxyribodipyrimidine photo-lyase [Candidatus Abyssubacteria bacterium SURF_5]